MPYATPAIGHLAVEATRLLAERRGIGRYVRSLLREFAVQRPGLRFTLFVRHPRDVEPMRAELARLHPTLNTRSWVETVDRLPHTDADVAWYPWNLVTAPAQHATRVVTVHDLAPMRQFDHGWWKLLERAQYRARCARTLSLADGVISISQFTREELLDRAGADATRITVTPLAADDLALEEADDPSVLERAGVRGAFFLSVGAPEARKNLSTLFDAMDALWARGVRVPLVQCGPGTARGARAGRRQAPWLHHVGFVTDAQLVTLYRRCAALVHPSRYEGFGLPVLEAMRAGAPVICSTTTALPEVAGAAAHYVAWDDAEAMSRAMQRVAGDAALRASLRAAGRDRAALFSWAGTARSTLTAFERTMAARGRVPLPASAPARVPVIRPAASREPLTAPAVIAAASGLHRAHNG